LNSINTAGYLAQKFKRLTELKNVLRLSPAFGGHLVEKGMTGMTAVGNHKRM
jgi:hypothetical protein